VWRWVVFVRRGRSSNFDRLARLIDYCAIPNTKSDISIWLLALSIMFFDLFHVLLETLANNTKLADTHNDLERKSSKSEAAAMELLHKLPTNSSNSCFERLPARRFGGYIQTKVTIADLHCLDHRRPLQPTFPWCTAKRNESQHWSNQKKNNKQNHWFIGRGSLFNKNIDFQYVNTPMTFATVCAHKCVNRDSIYITYFLHFIDKKIIQSCCDFIDRRLNK
jgi:hypothetical protein